AMPAFVEKADIRRIREDIDFAESIRGTDVNTQLRRLALSYARYGDGGYLRRVGQLASQLSITLLEDYARLIFSMEHTAILIEKPKKIVTPCREWLQSWRDSRDRPLSSSSHSHGDSAKWRIRSFGRITMRG